MWQSPSASTRSNEALRFRISPRHGLRGLWVQTVEGFPMCAEYSPARKNSSTTNSSNGASVGAGSGNGTQARTNGVHPSDIEPMVQERRVLKILQMIQSQPLRRIEELAREFNLSHSRLEHLFKQETGVSLGQLLTEQRLTRAAHLLLHTNMRIKE